MTYDHAPLFARAAELGSRHRATVGDRPVQAPFDSTQLVAVFAGPLADSGIPPEAVLEELAAAAAPGLMGTVGPRYFGFVIGGSSPASAAADILAIGWDQCAYSEALSPAAAAAERAAGQWAKELMGLPPNASVGFVTGAQGANTVGLAIGRRHVLEATGWSVDVDGLVGSPGVRVVASEERHATIDRALKLLGLGTGAVVPVPASGQGAIDVSALAAILDEHPETPTIVCLQAGNVNTGAVDDFATAIPMAQAAGAWVHVDGAFGLWAGASPSTRHLMTGVHLADSWGVDAHKWLNVPYDCGLAICRHPVEHAASVSYSAAYLTGSGAADDFVLGDLTPESSRRARGFAVWAALRELGREGVADLVDQSCAQARRFAEGLATGGARIHNDVVLNQVLIDLEGVDTDALVAAVQAEGTCWVGATTWHGQRLMRISVSNATTTDEDVDRSVAAILHAAASLT